MRKWKLPYRFRWFVVGLGTAAVVGCLEDPTTEPGYISLNVPSGISVAQGGSFSFAATLTRSDNVTGAMEITVTGLPLGVSSVVSDVQTTGLQTQATITISASATAAPGTYPLSVHGAGGGLRTSSPLGLTVSCAGPGLLCEQWALNATGSSEYTSTAWSALQAVGPPDASACTDDGLAWASADADGVEWLELTFRESVRPTEIRIHEILGVSSIVRVEVREALGTYHTVYTAQPEARTCPRVLIIPVTGVSSAVNTVRLTIDQTILKDWNEIDAVMLSGVR